jgi:hypothetical protein
MFGSPTALMNLPELDPPTVRAASAALNDATTSKQPKKAQSCVQILLFLGCMLWLQRGHEVDFVNLNGLDREIKRQRFPIKNLPGISG